MDRRDLLMASAGLGMVGIAGAADVAGAHDRGATRAAPAGARAAGMHASGAPDAPGAQAAAPCGALRVEVPRSAADVLRDGPPASLDRARELMAREGLDAIVVADPVNVYYFTGQWPVTSRMGVDGAALAVLTRAADRPIGLVTSEFTYYYILSDFQSSYTLAPYL